MFGTDRHGCILFPEFENHQFPAGLERLPDLVQHPLGPRKFVIRIGQQHQIEPAFGKSRIGLRAQHNLHIHDVPRRRSGRQLAQHFGLNVVGVNEAARRDTSRDAKAVKSGPGADIGNEHSRLEIHRRDRFFRLLFHLAIRAIQPICRSDAEQRGDASPGDGMHGLRKAEDAAQAGDAARTRRKLSYFRQHGWLTLISAVPWLFLASSAAFGSPANSNLAVIDAGVEQSEDAPFAPPDYQFLPGDYLYFSFDISGFAIRSEQRDEVHKISLTYTVTPEDIHGVALTPAQPGTIATELSPEDKNWLPKRRASFLIPSFVAAGEYRVHVEVKDAIAKTEVSHDFPFRIGGLTIHPSSSVTVEDFQFFRSENDRQPLELAAFSPGDTIYIHFDMTGFKTGSANEYHLSYGLNVTRPDGKPFLQKATAAELASNSFYPAQYLPGALEIKTPPDAEHGQYVIVLTVRDLIGNTTSELKKAFSIE